MRVYIFWAPYAACGTAAGYYGRLASIYERNWNNAVTLTYTWTSNASTIENIASIQVAHSDGQALTFAFATFGNNAELSTITRPDGKQVAYSYDTSGNLLEVDRPGTNTITTLPETYSYSGQLLTAIGTPRETLSYRATGGSPNDGEVFSIAYSGANVATISENGTMNFAPNDGSASTLWPNPNPTGAGLVIQPGITTQQFTWRQEQFAGIGTGTVTMTDWDGHATKWYVDNIAARETYRGEWNGSTYIATSSTWDAYNDLTASVDPNGNETDYAYDANGNVVEESAPSMPTSMGALHPLSLSSYDAYNNIIAYCDPVSNATAGRGWVAGYPASDTLCPVGGATQSALYNHSDPVEPFGYVTSSTDGLGNITNYQYSTASENGVDAGLVTSAIEPSFSQANGINLTPTTSYTYDAYGNITSVSNGVGTSTYTYDSLNRTTVETDADSVSAYHVYNPDGSVATEQSASQYAATQSSGSFVGTAYAYDADGDEISETIPGAHGTELVNGSLVPDAMRRTAMAGTTVAVSPTPSPLALPTPGFIPPNFVFAPAVTSYPTDRWQRFAAFTPQDLSLAGLAKRLAASATPSPAPLAGAASTARLAASCAVGCPKHPTIFIHAPPPASARSSTQGAAVLQGRVQTQGLTPPGATATTLKWYDGADRLVEVAQPRDSAIDYHPYPWMTRTLYDLTMGGSVQLKQWAQTLFQGGNGAAPTSSLTPSFHAHGNFFDTQVFVDMGWSRVSGTQFDCLPQWVDHTGNAYDILDRSTAKYDMARSTSPILTSTYDAAGQLGLLSTTTKITGETATYTYNAANKIAKVAFANGPTATPTRTYTYDPDLRAASIQSTALVGAQSYTYDANGRVLSATEPSGEGGNTISYTYAPNGWRQTLSVSGMINRKLFDYSYQADGKETQELVHSAPGPVGTYTWQYTAAGRLVQKTDPTLGYPITNPYTFVQTTVGPTINTYDGFGRRNLVTWPVRLSVPIGYDAVDSPSGDMTNSIPNFPTPLIYSMRKEWVVGYAYNNTTPDPLQFSANAHLTAPNLGGVNESFDLLDGNSLEIDSGLNNPGNPTVATYTYDSGGRETQTYSYVCNENAGTQGPSGGSSLQTSTIYDAEDHVASVTQTATDYSSICQVVDAPSDTASFTWGTNGHPVLIAGTNSNGALQHVQLHWDGDTLLFTSDDNGVHDVKIRGFGNVTEEHGYFYVYDRSQEGGLEGVHSTISSGFLPPACGGVGEGTISTDCEDVGEPTDESFQYFGQTIQGARGVDTTTTQWQTPDPVSGSIHDPMSQMPFVFERNNSVAYSDPTGYCAEDACVGEFLLGAAVRAGVPYIMGAIAGVIAGVLHSEAQNGGAQAAPRGAPQPEAGAAPTPQTNPFPGKNGEPSKPVDVPVTAVDSNGNAIPVPAGGRITESPNREFQQVLGAGDKETGTRIDGGGHPKQSDTRAHVPHAHQEGATTSDGNPHLPLRTSPMTKERE
jgi:YD repeat-containing protein